MLDDIVQSNWSNILRRASYYYMSYRSTIRPVIAETDHWLATDYYIITIQRQLHHTTNTIRNAGSRTFCAVRRTRSLIFSAQSIHAIILANERTNRNSFFTISDISNCWIIAFSIRWQANLFMPTMAAHSQSLWYVWFASNALCVMHPKDRTLLPCK